MRSVDPITVEIIRYDLISACEEIKKIFKRTTTLPVLYEVNDFGISIYDAQIRLLADTPGIPLFSGTLDWCVDAVVKEFGEGNLDPGDVIISNYPFSTGSQTSDVAVVSPIIHEGKVLGYAALKGHMGDFAAIDPYPSMSEDIYQEGIIFPNLKLYRKGVLDKEILRLIRFNSRIGYPTSANFLAAASALRAGTNRLLEIVKRYGPETFLKATTEILNHGELMARKTVEEISDGTWCGLDFMDSNGVESHPVKIHVQVTVQGSDLIVDLSGSAEQQKGPVNMPYPGTVSAVRYAFKALTTPLLPSNGGHFKPLKVIAPPGSIFNPKHPAPTFLYAWPGFRLMDLIPSVLHAAIPHKILACSGGDVCGAQLMYYDTETGHGDIGGGPEGQGTGAKSGFDGENGLMLDGVSGCCNAPVEVMENRIPVRIERYELRQDSGGAGRFRGGLGLRKDHRTLVDVMLITNAEKIERSVPWGLAGGRPGMNNRVVVHPDSKKQKVLGKYRGYLKANQVVSQQSGGGGGYGNPLDKDPKAVLSDVVNEYVSLWSAKNDYGTIIRRDKSGYYVDLKATEALRARLRKQRKRPQLKIGPVKC